MSTLPWPDDHVGHVWNQGVRVLLAILAVSICCHPVASEPVDRCGWLQEWDGCIVFQPTDCCEQYPTDLAFLPDSVLYTPIRLQGELVPCVGPCHSYLYETCITGALIRTCEPVDLGCGVLSGPYDDDYCFLWTSPIYGSLLSGLHGHSPGDTVGVTGVVDRSQASVCLIGDGGLWKETFYECPDTLNAVRRITWGRLKGSFR